MLNFMRKGANTFIVKLLLFFIALSFMVWGVGDYVNNQSQEPLAEAKNWSIGPREFAMAYDNEFQRMRQRFGGSLDKKTAEVLGLKQRTLNAMINRNLILDKGQDLRLTVSDNTLRESISHTPEFQKNGVFDAQHYDLVLRNNRMSPRDYEQKLKTDLISIQVQQVVGTTMHIPNLLIDDIHDLENEKRTAEVLTLPFDPLKASIKPSDEELTTFLEKNREHYLTPVQVRLNYILLTTDSVRESVSVSETEVDEYYNENKDDSVQDEKRRASHILFKVGDGVSEDQAKEKANAAKIRIDKGESFAAVAQELSEDVTAAQGGDLGLFSRGAMVEAFDNKVFSLQTGHISEPVTTPFGVHLIRVDEIHPAKNRPEQEVKTEIRGILTKKKALDMVYERSTVLEDQVFASGDLKTIAADLNLRYKEMDFFSRDAVAKLDTLEQDQKFMDAAFSTNKGGLSPVVELSEGRFFVLQVTDRHEPQPRPLKDIKDQVTKDYVQEKSVALAKEHMSRIHKELLEGTPWEKAASSHAALKTETLEPFVRTGQSPKASPTIRSAAFKLTLEAPIHTEIIQNPDSLLILRLKTVEKSDPTKFSEQERKVQVAKLMDSLGLEQLTAYLDGLWNASSIRINHKVMDQF